jgi:hypothetical protein
VGVEHSKVGGERYKVNALHTAQPGFNTCVLGTFAIKRISLSCPFNAKNAMIMLLREKKSAAVQRTSCSGDSDVTEF